MCPLEGACLEDLLFGSTIDCVHPFISFWMLSIYGLMVRDTSPEADGPMGMLYEVTHNLLCLIKVTNTGFSMEARESHDKIGNVKSAERNGPLEGSSEGLEE